MGQITERSRNISAIITILELGLQITDIATNHLTGMKIRILIDFPMILPNNAATARRRRIGRKCEAELKAKVKLNFNTA